MKNRTFHTFFIAALLPCIAVLFMCFQTLPTMATADEDNPLRFITDKDSVTIPEGSTNTFKVRLSQKPGVRISATVTREGGDEDITVQSGSVLIFNDKNWKKFQTVQLAAAQDPDMIHGQATIRISTVASAIPHKDVLALESDDDFLHFETDGDAVTVPEGGTAAFGVRLDAEPPAAVNASVAPVSGDEDITVQSGSSITFDGSNWNIYQTVTLAAAEDPDFQNGSTTILVSDAGGVIPDREVIATEADNDSFGVISPNGGEAWPAGTSHDISWTTGSDTGLSVTIELTRRGSFAGTIIPDTPNDGAFTWNIPADLESGTDYRVRITVLSDPQFFDESDADFSIVGSGEDSDTDGVPDTEEMGPAGVDPEYDGNGDGFPDSRQSTVASLHTFDGGHYVTLEGSGEMGSVAAMAPPLGAPEETAFPYGFFGFTLTNGLSGGPATVTLFTDGAPTDTYFKFGATPDDFVPHWYEFSYDPETVTGAEGDGFLITLHFVDGIRGDDDLSANGIVIDQGGPGVMAAGAADAASGDCFIATAVYGSPESPSVQLLREFRNTYLLTNPAGKWVVKNYYRYSPPAAKWLAKNDAARAGVRFLLTPLIVLAWLLQSNALVISLFVATCLVPCMLYALKRMGAFRRSHP